MTISEWNLKSIATFKCSKKRAIEASQQGILDPASIGEIDLHHHPQWQQMIQSLDGFSHVWLIFIFHHNSEKWKPMVWPPRSSKKVGVWASRSPYRPNPIGMSAVRLLAIEKSKLIIQSHDLLDNTPILDIKPYLPYADAINDATTGWLEDCEEYKIVWLEITQQLADSLETLGVSSFKAITEQQLKFHPTDSRRKRVQLFSQIVDEKLLPNIINKNIQFWTLSIRTWRIQFRISESEKKIEIVDIFSGYNTDELNNSEENPYLDKQIHHQFLEFKNSLT